MSYESKIDLSALGFDERFEVELAERYGPDCLAARVIRASRGLYRLRTAATEANGRLTGAFSHHRSGPEDLPVVGDWVAVQTVEDPKVPFRIEGVLSRRGVISRKQAGDEAVEQILAANVDFGFIVFSLEGGRKCSPRAAERYATMVWGSGATPVILLNKADLAADLEGSVAEIEAAAPGVEVLPLSCVTGHGVDEVGARIQKGRTAVLLGPSGVGKSTLINVLIGEERQATGEIRSRDMKGRHTTSHRELITLPNGAMIIDTPGLRELQLWADEADLDDSFSDIAAIAGDCRFRDCTHSGEPGCAVEAALAAGAITQERFASYLDLKKEVAFLERKTSDRLQRENRDKWKKINRQMRNFTKERRARG